MSGQPMVLVTRTQPGAAETASKLGALGCSAVVAPLLSVEPRALPQGSFNNAQAVLVSSPNAARELAQVLPPPRTPVLCVGETTARAARAAGCKAVMSADGEALELLREAARRFSPFAGRLVYVRGERVSVDIAGRLRTADFHVDEVIAYAALPTAQLPGTAESALRSGGLSAIVFHSAAAAETFAAHVQAGGLEWTCAGLAVAGISDKALAPLGGIEFGRVLVAERPSDAALLPALASALTGH